MKKIISVDSLNMSYKVKTSQYNNRNTFIRTIGDFINPSYNYIKALNDISFDVYEGDILGYIGQNGAGKSTTIKLLLGLLYPEKGEVSVLGKNPFKNRRKLSIFTGTVMGQKSHLWWELPLIDSFNFLQKIYGKTTEYDDKWLKMLIDELEVNTFSEQPVRQLSLGQRMRGEIICSLIHRPKILYLDEPTVGLDVFSKQKIMELLLKLNSEYKITIILTTHDMQEVEKICDRIILVEAGELEFIGGTEEFKALYSSYNKVLIESSEAISIDDERLIFFSMNKNSTEYIFDTSSISKNDVIIKINENIDIKNITFKPLDLSDVIKIRKKSNSYG